jgi:hypothetical protein
MLPLTVCTSTLALFKVSCRSPLTLSMSALPGAPATMTWPLTLLISSSRPAVPMTLISAATPSMSRLARVGTSMTSMVGSLLRSLMLRG